MVEVVSGVPLRPGCDLERTHLVGRVDRGEVERQRREPASSCRVSRRAREVAVPRLLPSLRGTGCRTRPRRSGSPAPARLSQTARDPGMVEPGRRSHAAPRGWISTYQRCRAAADRAALARARLLEGHVDVLAELVHPLAGERSLAGDDALGLEAPAGSASTSYSVVDSALSFSSSWCLSRGCA